MKILVTGGAGYIGSVAVKTLAERGHETFVLDNLEKGKAELIDVRAKFFRRDLSDNLDDVFGIKYDAVIHFAGYKAVEESMQDAPKYSRNITGTINLMNHAVRSGVKKLIFSSSAAVYGSSNEPLTEESKTEPTNFYGFCKLECEKIIEWYNRIHGIGYTNLRYFNVAGDVLGYNDPDAKNVFPIIMETIEGKRESFSIFGEDYDTPDGTCVRDYIHIQDLVDAHVLALENDYDGTINLGSGKGFSVKELVSAFRRISGVDFPVRIVGRRAGDSASVLASNEKAGRILGWKPRLGIEEMVESTLRVRGEGLKVQREGLKVQREGLKVQREGLGGGR